MSDRKFFWVVKSITFFKRVWIRSDFMVCEVKCEKQGDIGDFN